MEQLRQEMNLERRQARREREELLDERAALWKQLESHKVRSVHSWHAVCTSVNTGVSSVNKVTELAETTVDTRESGVSDSESHTHSVAEDHTPSVEGDLPSDAESVLPGGGDTTTITHTVTSMPSATVFVGSMPSTATTVASMPSTMTPTVSSMSSTATCISSPAVITVSSADAPIAASTVATAPPVAPETTGIPATVSTRLSGSGSTVPTSVLGVSTSVPTSVMPPVSGAHRTVTPVSRVTSPSAATPVLSSTPGTLNVMQSVTQLLDAQRAMMAAQVQATAAQTVPPLSKFSGEDFNSEEGSFERWVEGFEERAKAMGWNEEQRLFQVKAHLEKTAEHTVRMLPKKREV